MRGVLCSSHLDVLNMFFYKLAFGFVMTSYLAFLDAVVAASKPIETGNKRSCKRVHRNESERLDDQLDRAELIVARLTSEVGEEKTSKLLEAIAKQVSGVDLTAGSEVVDLTAADAVEEFDVNMPYGFWPRFIKEELNLIPSSAKKMRLKRALKQYAVRLHQGCKTRMAFRGMRTGSSQRSKGGAFNNAKDLGLGFALLQFFVNVVQDLQTRVDSALLMNHARELRGVLAHSLEHGAQLPKLIGNAGAQWFSRWRKRYGISRKVSGMKLKVSWRKIKRRVSVFLTNIFRLRALWAICHKDKPMRWLSVDQKPSWWNNAGLAKTWSKKGRRAHRFKENFAHTRSRYTILTAVPHGWKMSEHPDNVPKCAILFKGKKNGKIIRRLSRYPGAKPWLKLQVQKEGSYRSEDMVEVLDWMLPVAHSLDESIIVVLDWFSGHLTEEVEELVRSKGHVLLFHGGGTTAFTQVNDTHLHAKLTALLLEYEISMAENRRRELLAKGIKKCRASSTKT